LADSSVNLIVRWFAPAKTYRNAFFSLTEESKKALDKAGIAIPFPQRVIHTAKAES
jgi:small conductance mechanosensitive channel